MCHDISYVAFVILVGTAMIAVAIIAASLILSTAIGSRKEERSGEEG